MFRKWEGKKSARLTTPCPLLPQEGKRKKLMFN